MGTNADESAYSLLSPDNAGGSVAPVISKQKFDYVSFIKQNGKEKYDRLAYLAHFTCKIHDAKVGDILFPSSPSIVHLTTKGNLFMYPSANYLVFSISLD